MPPLLKWPGGKRHLTRLLLRYVPPRHTRYLEPFLGGGSFFFALQPRTALLGDVNRDLIDCYTAVSQAATSVAVRLEYHARHHSPTYYEQIRDSWNTGNRNDLVERAAFLLYLNYTCFNGLWRVNKKGEFNVSCGISPAFPPQADILEAGRVLAKSHLRSASWEWVLDEARPGDFVFLDPPYQPRSSTSNFTAYSAEGFGEPEQRKLAAAFRELQKRGCSVVETNSDTPLVRELYEGCTIRTSRRADKINCVPGKRGKVDEVVIGDA